MATNKSNLSLAHLLQVIFQFPDQELEGVSLQLNAGNEEEILIAIAGCEGPRARVLRLWYGVGCEPQTITTIGRAIGEPSGLIKRSLGSMLERMQRMSHRGPTAVRLQQLGIDLPGLDTIVVRHRQIQLIADCRVPVRPDSDISLQEIELSNPATDALRNAGLISLTLIIGKTEAELLRLPDIGRRRLSEVKEVLAKYNHHLRG